MFAMLPVNALRTFESAARLRSFKLAAAELTVTPTAISHQIKALEQQLGFALFERVPRGVRLTPKGETLFAGVHGALLDVAATLEGLRPQPSTGSLCVSVTHSFAALWLVPRLTFLPCVPTLSGAPGGLRRGDRSAAGRQRGRGGALQPRAVSCAASDGAAGGKLWRLRRAGAGRRRAGKPGADHRQVGIRRCTTAAGMTGAGPLA